MKDIFIPLFERDLDHLLREISAYTDENQLWLTPGEVNNSAGNLALHLCGNLQHFIGHIIGKSDYVRNRDFEFNGRLSLEEIQTEIQRTKKIVSDVLNNMSQQDWDSTYPIEVLKHTMTTSYFIAHLHGHLTYHLGQVSYHRRMINR